VWQWKESGEEVQNKGNDGGRQRRRCLMSMSGNHEYASEAEWQCAIRGMIPRLGKPPKDSSRFARIARSLPLYQDRNNQKLEIVGQELRLDARCELAGACHWTFPVGEDRSVEFEAKQETQAKCKAATKSCSRLLTLAP